MRKGGEEEGSVLGGEGRDAEMVDVREEGVGDGEVVWDCVK